MAKELRVSKSKAAAPRRPLVGLSNWERGMDRKIRLPIAETAKARTIKVKVEEGPATSVGQD
jgi:hypothetical protein